MYLVTDSEGNTVGVSTDYRNAVRLLSEHCNSFLENYTLLDYDTLGSMEYFKHNKGAPFHTVCKAYTTDEHCEAISVTGLEVIDVLAYGVLI